MADAWPDSEFSNMLDAQHFMTHGGQRGLQLSVLKPGTWQATIYAEGGGSSFARSIAGYLEIPVYAEVAAVPLPGTLAFLLAAVGGLGLLRRKGKERE